VKNIKNKIIHLSAYLVLFGFLSLTIADLFHFHKVDLGRLNSSSFSQYQEKNNHLNSSDNQGFCTIHYAFNLVHNSTLKCDNQFIKYQQQLSKLILPFVSGRTIEIISVNYSLRAPPNFS
jgi:hypothetical protein